MKESEEPTRTLRRTRQRIAIMHVLENTPGFHTAQEWLQIITERGHSVGLTTVYRTLSYLVDVGDVDAVMGEDGEMLYRMCPPTHHHHLTCRMCGVTHEIDDAAVEEWASAVSDRFGFTDIAHTVELFGTCPDCADVR